MVTNSDSHSSEPETSISCTWFRTRKNKSAENIMESTPSTPFGSILTREAPNPTPLKLRLNENPGTSAVTYVPTVSIVKPAYASVVKVERSQFERLNRVPSLAAPHVGGNIPVAP